jgi:hypothetical protein
MLATGCSVLGSDGSRLWEVVTGNYRCLLVRAQIFGIAMVLVRTTKAIHRNLLARICLEELRFWPGCEGVVSLGVLSEPAGRFKLRVIEYGEVQTRLADRALRIIERVKLREFHLESE